MFKANGLKFSFDVKTTLNISDMTFYPSQTTHGYDLYASSTDKDDILFLNLSTGNYYSNEFKCIFKYFYYLLFIFMN